MPLSPPAAITPATCVPWPKSVVVGGSLASASPSTLSWPAAGSTRPPKSGAEASTPVSATATSTGAGPRVAQADGMPISVMSHWLEANSGSFGVTATCPTKSGSA